MMKREGGEGRYPQRERERFFDTRECGVVASGVTHTSIQLLTVAPACSVIFSKWMRFLSLSVYICRMGILDLIPKRYACVGWGWGGGIMRRNIRIGPKQSFTSVLVLSSIHESNQSLPATPHPHPHGRGAGLGVTLSPRQGQAT